MGFTFKGDCPDIRNTKIIDVYNELTEYKLKIDVYDNWASKTEVYKEYKINLLENIPKNYYDGVIVAVDHSEYKRMGMPSIREFTLKNSVIYDVKHIFDKSDSDLRL